MSTGTQQGICYGAPHRACFQRMVERSQPRWGAEAMRIRKYGRIQERQWARTITKLRPTKLVLWALPAPLVLGPGCQCWHCSCHTLYISDVSVSTTPGWIQNFSVFFCHFRFTVPRPYLCCGCQRTMSRESATPNARLGIKNRNVWIWESINVIHMHDRT